VSAQTATATPHRLGRLAIRRDRPRFPTLNREGVPDDDSGGGLNEPEGPIRTRATRPPDHIAIPHGAERRPTRHSRSRSAPLHHPDPPPLADVCVLLSGGIDSSACVAFYLRLGNRVTALFVDHGQRARAEERRAARRMARHFSVPLQTVTISGGPALGPGEILGRNALLATVPLALRPSTPRVIAMGLHKGSPYPDCQPPFAEHIQRLFDLYTQGCTQFGTPFLAWERPAILALCAQERVPIAKTYSCERGTSPPCGACLSCRDRDPTNARA
jgi:7-cyano-7-deazaguanine synthase